MSKTAQTSPLVHVEACPDTRGLDISHYPDQKLTTYHCIECGAHVAIRDDGTVKPAPAVPGPFNTDDKPSILDGITMERAPANGGPR